MNTGVAVHVRVAGGTATLVISGDLDFASARSLAAQLGQVLADGPQRLVFDLTGVGFIDCAAARLIAGTARSLPPGQRPVIRSPGPRVRRLLELTGLDSQFEVGSGPMPG